MMQPDRKKKELLKREKLNKPTECCEYFAASAFATIRFISYFVEVKMFNKKGVATTATKKYEKWSATLCS